MSSAEHPLLQVLAHPYRRLRPLSPPLEDSVKSAACRGSALVWSMAAGRDRKTRRCIESRPGGMALIAILPNAIDLGSDPTPFEQLAALRPHGVLPFHETLVERELAQVLRRPPDDQGAAVTEYLRWRGFGLDRDTVHMVRRIFDLSAELRSVTALSRSMYLSRRALGRRFMSRGLPVPSHWLQIGRLLRVAVKLQNSDRSVFSVGYELGYPDGFAVSNQMHRLVGCRPSDARSFLGWEWIFESWLRREAETGGLAPNYASLAESVRSEAPEPPAEQPTRVTG